MLPTLVLKPVRTSHEKADTMAIKERRRPSRKSERCGAALLNPRSVARVMAWWCCEHFFLAFVWRSGGVLLNLS